MQQFASNCAGAAAAWVRDDRNNPEVNVQYSKCLPQSDKDLCGLDARYGRQIVSKINADWTDWRRIAEAESNGVGVAEAKIVHADSIEDISAVIKHRQAQSFLEKTEWRRREWRLHRNAEFRVQDQEPGSAGWYPDRRTRRRIGRIVAGRDSPLRSRGIQREAAQGAAATGEEFLA